MIKKEVTMSDIAKILKISTVTVSKALSDKDGVSEELRIKIKQKANELGYRFNYSSKNAKEGLTYNISVVVAKHFIHNASAFYWVVYRYLVELLHKQSYYGILDVISETDEKENTTPSSIIDKNVDGVIVLGQFSDSYVTALTSLGIPIVFLDFYSSGSDVETVISDNFFGAYTLTSYLINNGLTRIGFIGTVSSTSSIQDRYLGYYKALLENNLPMKPEWTIDDRGSDGVVYSEIALPLEMPEAFVCNCDETAYNFINQLKSLGYRIPEDISVVGYDNHIYSTISTPRITTVDVNSYRMSYETVEIIIKKIRDSEYKCGRVLVTGELVERDSVKLAENKKSHVY